MVMEGLVAEVMRESGEGCTVYSSIAGPIALGHGGLATRKFSLRFSQHKPYGGKAERVFVSVGVLLSKTVKTPLKWKLAVDGSTLSREIKPQVTVDLEEARYAKMVIDATPLLSSKFSERSVHNLFTYYDGAQPITLVDVFMVAVYRPLEDDNTSYHFKASYHTGALALEPGDVAKVYSTLGRAQDDAFRVAVAGVQVSSPQLRVYLVAGGSRRDYAAGPGYKLLRVDIPYRGVEVPVAVVNEPVDTPVYPRLSIVGDILVYESRIDGLRVAIRDVSMEYSNKQTVVKAVVYNEGSVELKRISIYVLPSPRHKVSIDSLKPGEHRSVRLLQAPGDKPPQWIAVEASAAGVPFYREYPIKHS
ncbi:hypothetical protein apy_07990 [Aeropyrum pernix]|uniref:Uncharacterized protein n=2 Tax=Aeropyrum pernix TaxID=56636 RepID=A0A401H9J7_AERPX|nr:hypothetical protein apy_07990 [Aeropyrum pernix]